MALFDGRAVASGTSISVRDTVDQVMAARTKSKVTRKYKTKYRVKNCKSSPWQAKALRRRSRRRQLGLGDDLVRQRDGVAA